MRLTVFALALIPAFGHSQTWEKLVSPGVVYRMELDTQTPRVVHAIRFAREAGFLAVRPELSQGMVYGHDDDLKGRDVLSKTIQAKEAVAGVNADFFPWTGDPLGAMVRDGEIVSKPFMGRSVFAWGPGYSTVSRLSWKGTASFMGQSAVKVDGLNEACTKDMVVLNTPAAGYALSDEKSIHAVLDIKEPLLPTGELSGKVVTTVRDMARVPVGRDQMVLTATGKSVEKFEFLAKGEKVTLKVATTGLDWSKAKNVVGGGPVIVSDGKAIQAWDAEDFNGDFASKRHPRTAIGSTKDGDVWLVIVEGRQALSVGATITELSQIMVSLGCTSALNLDGGGSSELALAGMVVNRPSDGSERPIANSILVFDKKKPPVPNGVEYVIQGKPRLPIGSATDYRVVDAKGRVVPVAGVVWAAQGDAWIDQGGRLRAIQAGKAKLQAWVNGNVVTLDVVIEAPSPTGGGR